MPIKLLDWQTDVYIRNESKFIIIPAGRRAGKTQGAAGAATIYAAGGNKVLWVDTINSNIDRYVERYFRQMVFSLGLRFEWNQQKKILKIGKGYIDFRSSDRPENIEGFGYDKIFLNEAGIILNNDSLYVNTILPMLIDYKGSQLYAFGTPKGKINKKGKDHRFYLLWQNVVNKVEGYSGRTFSTYDNYILPKNNIKELETEILRISPEAAQQEIYGQFIDSSEDKLFNFNDLEYFKLEELNDQNISAKIGAIDVADEGTDALSFPIGKLINNKIYITEWLYSTENTDYTLPTSAAMINNNQLNYCAIETNSQGSIFFKQLQNEISGTELLPKFHSKKKHDRIIANAGFIRNFFVFRNDYETGSDYDLAMRNLFSYTKDGKATHDDAPDSAAFLATVFRDIFSHIWFQ